VICHNDLSPCNFVFRTGSPVALIDFDTAAPGNRCMDLGSAALRVARPRKSRDHTGGAAAAAATVRRRLRRRYERRIDQEAIIYRQQLLAAEGDRTDRIAMAQWARQRRA